VKEGRGGFSGEQSGNNSQKKKGKDNGKLQDGMRQVRRQKGKVVETVGKSRTLHVGKDTTAGRFLVGGNYTMDCKVGGRRGQGTTQHTSLDYERAC